MGASLRVQKSLTAEKAPGQTASAHGGVQDSLGGDKLQDGFAGSDPLQDTLQVSAPANNPDLTAAPGQSGKSKLERPESGKDEEGEGDENKVEQPAEGETAGKAQAGPGGAPEGSPAPGGGPTGGGGAPDPKGAAAPEDGPADERAGGEPTTKGKASTGTAATGGGGSGTPAPASPEDGPAIARPEIGQRLVATAPQAKLEVGAPGDSYEREADRVADQVMRMPMPGASQANLPIQRKCANCEDEESVQRLGEGPMTPEAAQAQRARGAGATPHESMRSFFEPRMGADLGGVRVHTDASAGSLKLRQERFPHQREMEALFGHDLSHVAVELGRSTPFGLRGAEGATDGRTVQIASRAPSKGLIAHELAHRLQFENGRSNGAQTVMGAGLDSAEREADSVAERAERAEAAVRVRVREPATATIHASGMKPEDVAGEMKDETFSLTEQATIGGKIFPFGTEVRIETWNNTSHSVQVYRDEQVTTPGAGCSGPQTVTQRLRGSIDKAKLRPVGTPGDSVVDYANNVETLRSSIGAREAKMRHPDAQRPGEMTRLQGLQDVSYTEINKALIQQKMYNKFDAAIAKWSASYPPTFGFDPLDPNLVKSVIFKESRMGTSGPFISVTGHEINQPPNVMQMVDSNGFALSKMMLEDADLKYLVTKHGLQNILVDLEAKKRRLKTLKGKSPLTPAEQVEKSALEFEKERGGWKNWEPFFQNYPGFAAARAELIPDPDAQGQHDQTYEFWIRAGVRWLCEKRKEFGLTSWAETVRAYNGTGPLAEAYRKEVTGRAAEANRLGAAGQTVSVE
jgi:hypothetical protein